MLPRTLRPSTTDMTAAVAWAATGGFAVIFLVQVSLQSAVNINNRQRCCCAFKGISRSDFTSELLNSPVHCLQPFDWIKAQLGGPESEAGGGESTA